MKIITTALALVDAIRRLGIDTLAILIQDEIGRLTGEEGSFKAKRNGVHGIPLMMSYLWYQNGKIGKESGIWKLRYSEA